MSNNQIETTKKWICIRHWLLWPSTTTTTTTTISLSYIIEVKKEEKKNIFLIDLLVKIIIMIVILVFFFCGADFLFPTELKWPFVCLFYSLFRFLIKQSMQRVNNRVRVRTKMSNNNVPSPRDIHSNYVNCYCGSIANYY